MHLFSFEKLDVWQKSRELIRAIYKLTKSYPEEEKYGLTSQLRRAAVSVANNVSEGSARRTPKDQAKFTTMSFSSLMEVLNMLIISVDLEFMEEKEYLELRPLIEEVANKLNALRNKQNA